MTNEELSATELQNKVRAFSGGKIEYLVLKSDSFLDIAQNETYLLSEEGLKGWHLSGVSADRVEEFCRKDTEKRMAENPEWFNRV